MRLEQEGDSERALGPEGDAIMGIIFKSWIGEMLGGEKNGMEWLMFLYVRAGFPDPESFCR